MQILFLNMESDIGAAAAFVYAHGEAIKGLEQMLQLIDVHYDTVHEDGRAYADTDTRLVKEVRICTPTSISHQPPCRIQNHAA